jgi:ribosomal protein RSM22 (predicted rRNA methylase)
MRDKKEKSLKEHVESISKRYREHKAHEGFSDPKEYEAYFLYRTPATQAVLRKVLAHLEGKNLKTALELGSGPGSSYPVLKDLFFEKIVYIEKEEGFRREYPDVEWIMRNFLEDFCFPEAELVLFSYSLGELEVTDKILALKKAMSAAKNYLVVVEPGTPKGFDTLLTARDSMIQNGWHIHAPCYHTAECPKKRAPWCHFSERVQRTKLHRQIKGGSLGYEDEKYCYIIASKEPVYKKRFTILDTPKIEKHRLRMNLCTEGGQKIFECKANNKELFKILKKKQWGENLDSAILSGTIALF